MYTYQGIEYGPMPILIFTRENPKIRQLKEHIRVMVARRNNIIVSLPYIYPVDDFDDDNMNIPEIPLCKEMTSVNVSLKDCNRDIVDQALIMYDKYITLQLCLKKMCKDIKHRWWLPIEMWNIVCEFFRESVKDHDIHILKSTVILKELNMYDKEIKKKKVKDYSKSRKQFNKIKKIEYNQRQKNWNCRK